jgi:hypothetical protein
LLIPFGPDARVQSAEGSNVVGAFAASGKSAVLETV